MRARTDPALPRIENNTTAFAEIQRRDEGLRGWGRCRRDVNVVRWDSGRSGRVPPGQTARFHGFGNRRGRVPAPPWQAPRAQHIPALRPARLRRTGPREPVGPAHDTGTTIERVGHYIT